VRLAVLGFRQRHLEAQHHGHLILRVDHGDVDPQQPGCQLSLDRPEGVWLGQSLFEPLAQAPHRCAGGCRQCKLDRVGEQPLGQVDERVRRVAKPCGEQPLAMDLEQPLGGQLQQLEVVVLEAWPPVANDVEDQLAASGRQQVERCLQSVGPFIRDQPGG
jgi:hypothetical protein